LLLLLFQLVFEAGHAQGIAHGGSQEEENAPRSDSQTFNLCCIFQCQYRAAHLTRGKITRAAKRATSIFDSARNIIKKSWGASHYRVVYDINFLKKIL
jgi:hypothetical protein